MLTVSALWSPHRCPVPTPPSYSGSSYWPFPQLMHFYPGQADSLNGFPEEVIAIFWKFPISLTYCSVNFCLSATSLVKWKDTLLGEFVDFSCCRIFSLFFKRSKRKLIFEVPRTKLVTGLQLDTIYETNNDREKSWLCTAVLWLI